MSAFDIAGAAIATPMAVLVWLMFVYGFVCKPDEVKTIAFLFIWGLVFTAWSVFCIARLCGAHL